MGKANIRNQLVGKCVRKKQKQLYWKRKLNECKEKRKNMKNFMAFFKKERVASDKYGISVQRLKDYDEKEKMRKFEQKESGDVNSEEGKLYLDKVIESMNQMSVVGFVEQCSIE